MITCNTCGYAFEAGCRNPACTANDSLSESHRATLAARYAAAAIERERADAARAEAARISASTQAWADARRAARAVADECRTAFGRWAGDMAAAGFKMPPGPDRDAWRASESFSARQARTRTAWPPFGLPMPPLLATGRQTPMPSHSGAASRRQSSGWPRGAASKQGPGPRGPVTMPPRASQTLGNHQ